MFLYRNIFNRREHHRLTQSHLTISNTTAAANIRLRVCPPLDVSAKPASSCPPVHFIDDDDQRISGTDNTRSWNYLSSRLYLSFVVFFRVSVCS